MIKKDFSANHKPAMFFKQFSCDKPLERVLRGELLLRVLQPHPENPVPDRQVVLLGRERRHQVWEAGGLHLGHLVEGSAALEGSALLKKEGKRFAVF